TAAPYRPESHLLGDWECQLRNGAKAHLRFEAGGTAVFVGAFEYFNPAHWSLRGDRHELILSLPDTPNDKLDIFHLYIGDGVKAFNRPQKEVTYDFDDQTWSLNIAGWSY